MSPAKIMLFGEYSVLTGSDALAIPYEKYFGELKYIDDAIQNVKDAQESNRQLSLFCNYLENNKTIRHVIDIQTFRKDWHRGLHFASNIPVRYGLGSSGALTAEVYRNYSTKKTDDLLTIKKILASMESYFHGQSSGLDALVSYRNSLIRITNTQLDFAQDYKISQYKSFGVFLIDTGVQSFTRDIVLEFLKEYNGKIEYKKNIDHILSPAVSNAIESILTN
jgi:mevalonate kinase